jgi:catechol 2,3-dioxygenase-like lactoylglutathione lyase family enzyme
MSDFCPIKRVDHLEVYVGNARQAAAYYARTLGFSARWYRGLETGDRGAASYVLEQGKVRLVLTAALSPDHQKVWIKRGDVHAERAEDVVATSLEEVAAAVGAFTARGIPWVALQEHVAGPVVKFYGVTDGRFFNWYGSDAGYAGERPPVDENRLKALAFEAAAILGLEVFGGDVAFPEPDRPVLIDINDWPSFAPFRDDAARAIAAYITHRFAHRKHS